MSRTTFQNTLTELFALLADTNGVPVATLASAGVVKVYPHEPGATGVVKPCSVTLSPSMIDTLDWQITIRVYVADTTPAAAQDLCIDVPVTIDGLLTAGFGPSRWEIGWQPEIGCWLATSVLAVGREDGF